MEILPDRATDGARNSHVVFQAGPASAHRFENQVAKKSATLSPQAPVRVQLMPTGAVADYQTSKAAVANEDVRAQPKDEVRNLALPRCRDGRSQFICRPGFIEEVCRAANPEGRKRRERHAPSDSRIPERAYESCRIRRRG